MKDFLDKWEILLELEEDYQDVTWQGEYIYPYIRTKLYGILHRDYNYLDNNTKPLGKFAAETLILEKQLSAFFLGEKEDTKCDILYVPFYRFKFDGSDFIDERSDLIYKDLKNQNLDVIRLIYKAQSPFLPSDKNTYYMDDINKLVDERAILFDEIQSEELEKLYRLQKDIQEKLNIRFVVDDYLKEFGNRAIGYREYLRRALEILKPKAIVLPASYLFSDLVIVAHEQGIPVIDVQYAALTNAHVGYNFKSQSRTFPDVLLGWGRFWDRKEVFGTQRYTFIPVGKKQDFDVSKEKNSEKIVFISQNLITKFIFEEAMKFAGNFPSYEVIIKLHPNDNYPEILKEQIKKYNNIKVITKGMDKITDAQYVVGVGSSLLYELISSDTKVIILDNYMKAFMRGLAEKENVYFVKDLVKDFSKICNYNFNEVINLNQNYETIDYKKIIRNININHENSIPTVSGEHVNFDVFKIKDMLNNVGTLTIENFGNSLTSVKSLEEEYLLSIVVGVFNDEDNVELLFKSLEDLEIVKNQTAEVIFIDAGSKDKTVSKIEEKIYGRKNIHVYKGNPNSPTSALQTRKRGTLYSKGEYVYYLDGDDFISPFNLDIAAIYLSKYRVDLLKGSVNVHFTDNDSLTTWRLPYSYIDKKYEFTNDVNLSLPLRFMHNHIYRKDLINLDNFDKVDIKVSEDHYFNDLQYLDMKKVAVLPLSFNVYRKRTEGTESTKEYTEEKYYTSLKAFLTVLREFDESKVWNRDSFIKYINKVYIKGLLDTVPQLPNTTSDIFSNRVLEIIEIINNFLINNFAFAFDFSEKALKSLLTRKTNVELSHSQFVWYKDMLFFQGDIEDFDLLNSEILPKSEYGHVVFDLSKLKMGRTTVTCHNVYIQNFKKTFGNIVLQVVDNQWTFIRSTAIQELISFTKKGVWITSSTSQGITNCTNFVAYKCMRKARPSKIAGYSSEDLSGIKTTSVPTENSLINHKKEDLSIVISEIGENYTIDLKFYGKLIVNSLRYSNGAQLIIPKNQIIDSYKVNIEYLKKLINIEDIQNNTDLEVCLFNEGFEIIPNVFNNLSLDSIIEDLDLDLDLD